MTHRSDLLTKLLIDIRETIFECEPFTDAHQLRILFFDPRIYPWQNRIPTTSSSLYDLTHQVINILLDRQSASGENALAQFLFVLADSFQAEDRCVKSFYDLAEALNQLRNTNVSNDAPPSTNTNIFIQKIVESIELEFQFDLKGWQIGARNTSAEDLRKINVIFRPTPSISVAPNIIKIGRLAPFQSTSSGAQVSIRADAKDFEEMFELSFSLVYTVKQKQKRIETSITIPIPPS